MLYNAIASVCWISGAVFLIIYDHPVFGFLFATAALFDHFTSKTKTTVNTKEETQASSPDADD